MAKYYIFFVLLGVLFGLQLSSNLPQQEHELDEHVFDPKNTLFIGSSHHEIRFEEEKEGTVYTWVWDGGPVAPEEFIKRFCAEFTCRRPNEN